jgi:hypothetical protein
MSALNEQMLGGTATALRPFAGSVVVMKPLGGTIVSTSAYSGQASLCQ